jgi:hypothetical protein
MSSQPDDRLSPVVRATQDQIETIARRLGRFDKVQTHEPKSAPGSGLTFAAWLQMLRPVAAMSGLAVSSMLVVFNARIYLSMLGEPMDSIDVNAAAVAAEMMAQLHGGFVLPGISPDRAELDLLNRHGVPLEARAGYLNQDGKLLRIIDLFVPVIAYDVFDQEES